MLLALLTNLKIYSQKIVSDNKGDTTICFSVPQGKYLLKKVAELEKCDTLRNVCENQLKNSQKLVKDKDKIINKIMAISDNQNTMLKLKEGQLEKAKADLELAKKDLRKEKVKRIISVVITIAVTIASGTYILTH
jgi:hypothetical protein